MVLTRCGKTTGVERGEAPFLLPLERPNVAFKGGRGRTLANSRAEAALRDATAGKTLER